MTTPHVHVIGAGLAGSESAWQLANAGIQVTLHEMRPARETFAHQTGDCAELVCSNSLRSDDADYNAVGLLHAEMEKCNSIVIAMAKKFRVPAGGALAVDRHAFSQAITEHLENHPNITLSRAEVTTLPLADWGTTIMATGPLTTENLSEQIIKITGSENLSFFDAIAPIVHAHSIDMTVAWKQSRYDKTDTDTVGDGADYINCPMTKDQYYTFIDALLAGDKTEFKDWEKNTPYFEGCLPIEIMAERGRQTLAFGPMKPVGLTNPHIPADAPLVDKPYAVVQLRQDNALGTLWNLVGFQTKLKYGAQTEIFRTIPGLHNAEFARLGGIHRNTFINSPILLDETMRLKSAPHLRFAGQITGVEGYVESASMGILVGRITAGELLSTPITLPPITTAMGALANHVTTGADAKTFQPMNVNFGLFPPPPMPEPTAEDLQKNRKPKRKLKGRDRKLAITTRAKPDFDAWLADNPIPTQ